MDNDPFVDLSLMNERYQTLRENIQKEYDSNKAQPQNTTTSSPTTSSIASPSFAMPVPPAQFSFTATPLATSVPASSGFSWPPLAASSTPSFSFGATKPPASGYFVFGNQAGGETSRAETAVKPDEDQKESTDPKPSGPSSSAATQSFFKPPSAPMTPGFASFLSTPSLNSSPKSPSTAFGSSLTASNGNIGNPVGFSFGNVTPKSPAPASDSPTPNVFSSAPVKQEATEDDSDAGTPQNVESEAKEDFVNPYDKDSVGEEDEETLFETKSRAYISITGENNQKTWSCMGAGKSITGWFTMSLYLQAGQLKLKKKKDGTKRRLLMRNSSNGKIIVVCLKSPKSCCCIITVLICGKEYTRCSRL